MNIEAFKNLVENCELKGDKLVISSNLKNAIEVVKNDFHFDLLKEIVAVDNKEEGVELTYNLYSTADEETFLISINVKDEAESIVELFDSAMADEKEIFDMFGIKFIGNEELKRLYMPENWEGNPLKKD